MKDLRSYLTETTLNEVAFFNSSFKTAVELIVKQLSKTMGKLYPYGGYKNYEEWYKKSNGMNGYGLRFISDKGEMVRFNIDSKIKSKQITSIDYWKNNSNFNQPYKSIDVPLQMNSIEMIHKILNILIKDEQISEGRFPKDWEEQAKKNNIDMSLPPSEINKILREIKSKKGVKEVTSRDEEIKHAESVLSSNPEADVDVIFEDLKDLVKMVCVGSQPSLLVTGMPGTGKTFTITNVIKDFKGPEGKNWILVKGKVSTLGLYSALFVHRDSLIVFDDSDSVFSNQDSINILKSALDSYEERTISWFSRMTQDVTKMSQDELDDFYVRCEQAIKDNDPSIKLPNKFEFTGKIIFVSNLNASKIDSAIKNRSFVIDITLERQQIIKRIESILPQIGGDISLKIKKEVLSALKEYDGLEEISMRSFIKALRIRESDTPRWKELIRKFL